MFPRTSGPFQIEGIEWFVLLILIFSVLPVAIAGGLWIYKDAKRHSMDASLWLALVLLGAFLGLGLGGLLVIGMYRMMRPKYPSPGGPWSVIPGSRVAFCSKCGQPLSLIPQYARWYCPHCGQYR